jgi:hypothetical protein
MDLSYCYKRKTNLCYFTCSQIQVVVIVVKFYILNLISQILDCLLLSVETDQIVRSWIQVSSFFGKYNYYSSCEIWSHKKMYIEHENICKHGWPICSQVWTSKDTLHSIQKSCAKVITWTLILEKAVIYCCKIRGVGKKWTRLTYFAETYLNFLGIGQSMDFL